MADFVQISKLFVEQVVLLSLKSVSQKARNGRQFWKDTVFIQFFMLAFTVYILYSSTTVYPSPKVYQYHSLPPLTDSKPWGIFSPDAHGNLPDGGTLISQRLYFCPDNHPAVNDLITALVAKYPKIKAIGVANPNKVNDLYSENLFDSWASLQFDLTQEQIDSGSFVSNQTGTTDVNYAILINPINWGVGLSTDDYTQTSDVYNDLSCAPDLFWSSGYMTLQNYIATYLAKQYTSTPADFSVDTFVQRYTKSPVYSDDQDIDIASVRYTTWAWLGGTVLSILLFTPMLSLLTEIVYERQYKMKDLLEISGLMDAPYWTSYFLVIFLITQISMWVCILLLTACNILTASRIYPYAGLLDRKSVV